MLNLQKTQARVIFIGFLIYYQYDHLTTIRSNSITINVIITISFVSITDTSTSLISNLLRIH